MRLNLKQALLLLFWLAMAGLLVGTIWLEWAVH